ncbi:MAG: energy-coupling factor transporter transmembrane component T [Fervidicoccaceae archaeon]
MSSFLERATPLSKTILAIIIIVPPMMSGSVELALASLLYAAVLSSLGGIDFSKLTRDVAPFSPLLLGVPLGNAVIAWTRGAEPLEAGARAAAMLGVLVMSAAIFAYTTTPDDFAYMLAKHLRLPPAFALGVAMVYGLLVDSLARYHRVLEALRARRIVKSRADVLRNFVPIVANLIYYVTRRSEELSVALEIKGYGNPRRTYAYAPRLGLLDLMLVIPAAVYVGAALVALGSR